MDSLPLNKKDHKKRYQSASRDQLSRLPNPIEHQAFYLPIYYNFTIDVS